MQLEPVVPTAKGVPHHFVGDVYLNSIRRPDKDSGSRVHAAMTHYMPGARSFWHTHTVGMTLHCTDGAGLVVTRDGSVIPIGPGDTVWTPAGEEHWHGATDDRMMSHLMLVEHVEDGSVSSFQEAVTDEQYAAANAAVRTARAARR